MKIDIQIEEDWKHTEVAILVDREDFLEDIQVARRLLHIKRLIPHTQEAINRWKEEEQNKAIRIPIDKKTSGSKKRSFHSQ